jgi:hypothetical protein
VEILLAVERVYIEEFRCRLFRFELRDGGHKSKDC